MATFKCKMCGGALEIEDNKTFVTCEYCGTRQTLPRLDDDRRVSMYDRANHFRRNNEFDKAMGIYEQILNEDNSDAEAYWSLVLCRYGIEYVEDPSSHKRIPTVNRAQFTSVYDDDNYKSALKYADSYQRIIYEEEAKTINEIQKGILAISQKEDPFDVFICYKETDASGGRTQDSVLAQDLYYQLKQEGFKVFFSRITLEDKLGTAYEPYIFAALNSARVMVAVGTCAANFNAVWVKNEWARFLSLIKQGQKKVLIPAYKDMDPYDLPEEFSHLQAQDMSKLGFMQDLIRGIKKIISAEAPVKEKSAPTVVSGGLNAALLLKRAFMFLEDGNFKEANEYCEKVLDLDPENADAYLGKLMAATKTRKEEELADCAKFYNSVNYEKIMRYGSDKLKSELRDYADKARKNEIFAHAMGEMSKHVFYGHNVPLDNSQRAIYYQNAINGFQSAIDYFKSVSGWKNADEKVDECLQKIEEIKERQEAERLQAEEERIRAKQNVKKRKKAIGIGALAVCVCVAFIVLLTNVIIPNGKYNAALKLYNAGKYDEAMNAFTKLNGYKDSKNKANEAYEKYMTYEIKNAKIGDLVYFGAYEQDNNPSNGEEYIEWTVIDKKGDEVLLISKYSLDCKKYNNSNTNVTWESCSLRSWLNNEFYNSAFSLAERSKIKTTLVSADKNSGYSTNPGNATNDKVFLLSIIEAEKYFKTDEERRCLPTANAIANGDGNNATDRVDGKVFCRWWLRSPGYDQRHAALVYYEGDIDNYGLYAAYGNYYVRPALWITL